VASRKFFYARSVGEEKILHCYRLAKFYAVDPAIFLNKPISELVSALEWTEKLIERINIESAVSEH
jgi:hypothetical protein